MTGQKAIDLHGSCHCKAVTFKLRSQTPCPYTHCYCQLCRKVNGGFGGAIALTGDAKTFNVQGTENLSIYRAKAEVKPGKVEQMEAWRHFCKNCGTHLWTWVPSMPDAINPFASCIDTPLPDPPERHHIFLKDKANWAFVPKEDNHHKHFDGFPDLDPPTWHKKHKVFHE